VYGVFAGDGKRRHASDKLRIGVQLIDKFAITSQEQAESLVAEMEKQPLVIGIDYSNEYCQACYYNLRHGRPESVMTGAAVMRYLIPAVLCYSEEKSDWLIGEEAMLYAEQTGAFLFRRLLTGMLNKETCEINGNKHTYDYLVAVYFGKLLELIQLHSGLTAIENITVTMRRVNLELKQAIEGVFGLLQVDPSIVRIQSYACCLTLMRTVSLQTSSRLRGPTGIRSCM